MWYLTIYALTLLAFIPKVGLGQCPIDCSKEAFPYTFCDPTGKQIVECSTDPNNYGHGDKVAKSWIPGCVNVTPMPPELTWQGITDYGPPPSLPILDPPPPTDPGPNPGAGNPGYDEWCYAVALYNEFYADFPCYNDTHVPCPMLLTEPQFQPDPGPEPLITMVQQHYDWQYARGLYDQYQLDEEWWTEYGADYNTQLNAYNNWKTLTFSSLDYKLIFDYIQAPLDAQKALQDWTNLCPNTAGHGDANCCITIVPDDNADDWRGNYVSTPGNPISYKIGVTVNGYNIGCPESQCPSSSSRYIRYNTCNKLLYKNNADVVVQETDFPLYPCPSVNWYTGTTAPSGSDDYSFYQLMEHEMGHWLGLHHPDDLTTENAECVNNFTQCHLHMVMGQNDNLPGNDPEELQADDKCMFEKLYCPTTQTGAVHELQTERDIFDPQLYPNPSNGSVMLQYQLAKEASVEVTITDFAGREIGVYPQGRLAPNTYSMQLRTEQLPSGDYICRVRAGNVVAYVNFIIVK